MVNAYTCFKAIVHDILRDRWLELQDEDKEVWRKWALWHKKRYKRDLDIYSAKNDESHTRDTPREEDKEVTTTAVHVPKKRPSTAEHADGGSPFTSIPKKSRHG